MLYHFNICLPVCHNLNKWHRKDLQRQAALCHKRLSHHKIHISSLCQAPRCWCVCDACIRIIPGRTDWFHCQLRITSSQSSAVVPSRARSNDGTKCKPGSSKLALKLLTNERDSATVGLLYRLPSYPNCRLCFYFLFWTRLSQIFMKFRSQFWCWKTTNHGLMLIFWALMLLYPIVLKWVVSPTHLHCCLFSDIQRQSLFFPCNCFHQRLQRKFAGTAWMSCPFLYLGHMGRQRYLEFQQLEMKINKKCHTNDMYSANRPGPGQRIWTPIKTGVDRSHP
jgi:hypothetical protein